jgi:hypothetical protein
MRWTPIAFSLRVRNWGHPLAKPTLTAVSACLAASLAVRLLFLLNAA